VGTGGSRAVDAASGERSAGLAGRLATGVLVLYVLILIVFPGFRQGLFWSFEAGGEKAPALAVWGPLVHSVWVAGLIAAGAAAMGLPLGVWIARRGWGPAAVMVAAMLMPSTLAYAGWGLLRAPGTALGDWLERTAEHGHAWVVVFAGRALAVLGLVLWSAPVAGLVSGVMLRRVDRAVFESMRMEATGWWSRGVALARLGMPAGLASAGVVFVLMLGSAVPLHLAQMPTLAVELWKLMDTTPQAGWWRVWLAAWPVGVLALGAAWLVVRQVRAGVEGAADAELGSQGAAWSRGGLARWWGVVMVLLGVAMPAAMLILSVRQWASFGRFWTVRGGALADSLMVAGMAGVAGVVLAQASAAAVSGGNRRVVWLALGALAWTAVMPGVLVGAMLARGYAGEWARGLTDAGVFVALGHVARFGVVAVLLGVWSARSEARGQRELRSVDGAWTLAGWMRTGAVVHGPASVCAGLVMGALSLQEIEASVMLQPPGVENLAKQVLQMLHFSRMEELSVAVSYLVGLGGLAAVGAGWVLRVFVRNLEAGGTSERRTTGS